jgi:hypothetical protein
MEPLQTLKDFYKATSDDTRITTAHVAVYVAFICVWSTQKMYPIQITRKQIMHLAKIKGIATYQKCIRELQLYEYILYQPSYNPQGKSVISLRNLLNDSSS